MNMIERVARALCLLSVQGELLPPQQWFVDENWHEFVPQARAAIEAMREPTEGMERAAVVSWENYNGLAIAYTAMIDAALEEGK